MTRCSVSAASDCSTTRSEIAVAQSPDSTAARTASFDGSSRRISRSDNLMPNFLSAVSNMDLVPEPGSRRIHHVSLRTPAVKRVLPIPGGLAPTPPPHQPPPLLHLA